MVFLRNGLSKYPGFKLSAEAPRTVTSKPKRASKVSAFEIPATRQQTEKNPLWRSALGLSAKRKTFSFEDFLNQYARREWTASERKEGLKEPPQELMTKTFYLGTLHRHETWPTSESVTSGSAHIGESGNVYLQVTRSDRSFNAGVGSLWQGRMRDSESSETWYLIKLKFPR